MRSIASKSFGCALGTFDLGSLVDVLCKCSGLKYEKGRISMSRMPSIVVRLSIVLAAFIYPAICRASPSFYVDSDLGLALDVKSAGTANGTPVQIWDPNTSAAQLWEFIDANNGFYFVRSGTGKFLDVTGNSGVAGTPAQTWEFVGGANQKWKLLSPGDGPDLLQSGLGTFLDVQWGVGARGTPVWTWTRNGGPAQRWWLSRADDNIDLGVVKVPLTPPAVPSPDLSRATRRVVMPNSFGGRCPVGSTRGDAEFGGGPRIHSSALLTVSADGRGLDARVTFFATEMGGDESSTEGVWFQRVYTIESGKRIVALHTPPFSEVAYRGANAGAEFLVCNDGAVEAHRPAFGPVDTFSIIGDTGAGDISADTDCRCDTQLKGITFRPVEISVMSNL